ncbi:MAG: septum formation protein Maf [Candidatus Hydrogenedentes bacterium]|nr:septum formation protein Maf [Candidatus Hydrogenedentota bacterium]
MTRLVLASASPRRRALLAALGLTFQVVHSDVVEILSGDPAGATITNARAKRDVAASRTSAPAVVLGADTLVVANDEILGKPKDLDEARRMLARLSGNTHRVVTGLSLIDTESGLGAEGSEVTRVTFRTLADHEIKRFVSVVKPLDRAGAYTVDGPGSLLVERYEGCYLNVLGLPIVKLDNLLRTIGYSLFTLMNAERSRFL